MNKHYFVVQKYLDANMALDRVYKFQYEGKWFIGINTVFSPVVFEDTYFFAKHIPSKPNDRFLEIGCGTGFVSICKALDGSSVTATDINLDALTNTKINAILHSVEQKVCVLYSDVFDSLSKSDIFDVIFWNTPFIFSKTLPNTSLEKSVFNFEYSSIKKFIAEVKSYLKSNGRAFLGFSSTSGDFSYLYNICNERGIALKLVAQSFLEGNDYEEKFSLELYELI
ncbi:methyltransferase [Lyngbya sp. CCAP 1446/10]|uniref:methyltransferase n=1 Tax=Lyngbya sp. CCAP 1446/10 TaxID=439293 RepID=UPI002237180E|nr:methyltransferase [Lyngbya sp. CCAP 1446/10]MCW6052828.1 methyltransferase [Lyngbya sp. CCAP 1446/10]